MKKKNTKTYYEEIIQTVDKETGEIEVIEKKARRKVSRDKFIMMFLEDIQGVINLTSRAEFKVLIVICELVNYNTNEVILIKRIKEDIAKKISMSPASVANTIVRLAKKKILIKTSSSLYVLNPKYFFKGEEIERGKVLKLVLEYELE